MASPHDPGANEQRHINTSSFNEQAIQSIGRCVPGAGGGGGCRMSMTIRASVVCNWPLIASS